MTVRLSHPSGEVSIEELTTGRRRLQVKLPRRAPGPACETAYPVALIQAVLDAKGPLAVCDEIAREEQAAYVRLCLEHDLFAYVPAADFTGRRLLDFGCGAGASTILLARLLPETQIFGVDLEERLLKCARARAAHYQFDHLHFAAMSEPDRLPDDLGRFDFIVLSAVFEHLLPAERTQLLPMLWSHLEPGGTLFLNQTPWRWFPLEGHTTRLPLINYLPDGLALHYARLFSPRVDRRATWPSLLRRGIRGGSVREILACLDRPDLSRPVLLAPCRPGLRDRIDIWQAGYAQAIACKYPWAKPLQIPLFAAFKLCRALTGVQITPALSLALRKPTRDN